MVLLEQLLLVNVVPRGPVGNIHPWGVGDGPLRLEECDDVEVLFLHCNLHWGLVEVVQERGIGKAVNEMLHTAVRPFSAGKEESCLTLWEVGEREKGEQSVAVNLNIDYLCDCIVFQVNRAA